MSRLRTYAPMARRSAKRAEGATQFQAAYRAVDLRSGGRCEAFGYDISNAVVLARCPRMAADHHHLFKPRQSHQHPDKIVHLCRGHHERCEWPYKRGRLVVTALGGGKFSFAIRFASDKFSAREVRA